MRIHLRTFGCTYNQADSDGIAAALQKAGHCLVPENEADVVLLNTCAVKDATEQKQLHQLRMQKRPVLVTGCLAQNAPDAIHSAKPSAGVVGTFSQGRILEAVDALRKDQPVRFLGRAPHLSQSGRANGAISRIQVSRGCLSHCSFCQTKRARGHLQSVFVGDVRRLAREQLASGAREIQLCSQDCGCYGFDEKTNAAELLRALSGLGGDYRVRLGMGNPEHFALFFDDLLDAMAHPNIYKFLHIPVQSGSDAVLLHMNRPYTAAAFADLARRFRNRFPDGLLATDVIVGYPAETEADFGQTLDLIRQTRPDFVNVSKFSPRPGTAAAKLPLLDNRLVKERSTLCSALCRRIAAENNARFVGTELDVLAVEPAEHGGVLCRSDDYRPVVMETMSIGLRLGVSITAAGAGFLKGDAVWAETPIRLKSVATA